MTPQARAEPPTPATDAPVVTRDDMVEGGTPYPARLLKSYAAWQGPEGNKRLTWYQAFERLDQKRPDGEKVETFNYLILKWPSGDPARKGQDADLVAKSFQAACGADLLPGTDGADSFIGHAFMMKDVSTRKYKNAAGDDRESYVRMADDYLGGADWKFDGAVREVNYPNVPTDTGANVSTAPTIDPDEDKANALKLALHLDGMTAASIKAGEAFESSIELLGAGNAPKTLLNRSLRGGLVQPNAVLLDALCQEGYTEIVDGVVKVNDEKEASG